MIAMKDPFSEKTETLTKYVAKHGRRARVSVVMVMVMVMMVRNLRRRVVFSTAVNLVCQSVDKKSLSRVFHMMSLPWARVMVWRRMGTAIMAICE